MGVPSKEEGVSNASTPPKKNHTAKKKVGLYAQQQCKQKVTSTINYCGETKAGQVKLKCLAERCVFIFFGGWEVDHLTKSRGVIPSLCQVCRLPNRD